MPNLSRSLALLGLMAATTVPALAHAGCPYMSVMIEGPSEISHYGTQYYQAVTVGGTISPALYYTWSSRYGQSYYGSVWGPTSTHQGSDIEAVNQISASCFNKRIELKVVVTDSCGVTATATKIIRFNASECP
jgi:hypothetical protein